MVNDQFGHAAGDALLVEAAARIRQCLRSEDSLARLGGDEFVIALLDIDGTLDVTTVATRIVAAMAVPFTIERAVVAVGTSVGIALSSPLNWDPEQLLRQADWAMYQAKRAGRGRWQVYRSLDEAASTDSEGLETDLPGALNRGELIVQLEPRLNPDIGVVAGLRARLYWVHPDHGLLEAVKFMPIAARVGLTTVIEVWLLETACHRTKE